MSGPVTSRQKDVEYIEMITEYKVHRNSLSVKGTYYHKISIFS